MDHRHQSTSRRGLRSSQSLTIPTHIDICLSIFGAFSFTDPMSLLAAACRAIRPGGLLAMTLRADEHHDSVIVLSRR